MNSKKLNLLSIHYRGKRYSIFIQGPITVDAIQRFARSCGVRVGDVFAIGA